ncbi:hypothetical protein V6Z11_D05G343500 [Gossypium hirsutum]
MLLGRTSIDSFKEIYPNHQEAQEKDEHFLFPWLGCFHERQPPNVYQSQDYQHPEKLQSALIPPNRSDFLILLLQNQDPYHRLELFVAQLLEKSNCLFQQQRRDGGQPSLGQNVPNLHGLVQ